ncbi:Hsp20/alpha crystallin family protein [Candidatus Bathyarchaeota archaeon]|nr:MAG: Hsp20/alpha crystallin family protein [Candidatus Bathyarchaeota archaeon]
MRMYLKEKRKLSGEWRRKRRYSKGWFKVFKEKKEREKNAIFDFEVKRIGKKRFVYPHKYFLNSRKKKRWKELEPLIEMFEEKNDFVVIAQFLGFKRENLKVKIKNKRLTLLAENSEGKYRKSLNLPKNVIPKIFRTTYKNGVLEIRLKKTLEEKALTKQ